MSTADPWQSLRRFTSARIALGRAGAAVPTTAVLALRLAHAQARDAVLRPLDVELLQDELQGRIQRRAVVVQSQAGDLAMHLRRPDLGRRLSAESADLLSGQKSTAELVLVLADGLSALALHRHAAPLLAALADAGQPVSSAPLVLLRHGRVGTGDEIGELLGARLLVMVIGERPGLSAADSLGVYITYEPRKGRTDAERNCVSNIRPGGLSYGAAAGLISMLTGAALQAKLTGVALKSDHLLLEQKIADDHGIDAGGVEAARRIAR